ncbi:MAG: type II toxin-antitoxin system VapB family antitoxin [Moorella sp. (in: Bacteria)]|nr:type II toxin-antitoxin system VapB family antitoxin [Moorella sp. (in: firmicutes)]
MKTTLYVNRDLLQQAMDLSGIKSRTDVIDAALKEFVRRKRLERLAASLGKVELALDDRSLEELRRDE